MDASPPPLSPADGHRDPGLTGSRAFGLGLVAAIALLLAALWLLPALEPLRRSEGLFPVWLHTTAEIVAISVAMMVFAVSWNAYRPDRESSVVLLACAFLGAALLDFGHLLSYAGMPDFITPASPQKSIAFWLSARTLASLVVLYVAFHPWQPMREPRRRYAWLAATVAIVAAVYYLQLWQPQLWPRFFIEGQGLTPIKVGIEALLVLMMLVTALRLWFAPPPDAPFPVPGLLTAALLWSLAELSLMSYTSVNDVFSLVGHATKVLAYLFVYRVVFVSSVHEPYRRLTLEIADKQAAELQVEALAFYDVLTGLANKALLRERAGQMLAASRRSGEHCALLHIDVDGFGHVNDSLGHAFGDALLRAIAERLPRCVASADLVARIGGDEFAVLLHRVADAKAVASVQEAILAELGRPMQVLGQETRITASIGAAISPRDGRSFERLFQNAITALHQAKKAGPNSWRFYDSAMNQEIGERLQLRSGLREALEREQFVLHYQPQVDLRTGALVGVEALVRWHHPGRGTVSPMRFIPEAEDSGLIVPIGEWILHEACRQMVAWQRAGLAPPVVGVNLSAVQFRRGDVERLVLDALSRSGLAASSLELELTESILIQDAPAVLATVRKLRTLGVRLSIDDFGTGYSSLAYLRDFPLDKLKVDQSFVREMGARADGEVIVATIIQLARSLGLVTMAEGVEDEASAATLVRLGCAQAQGFLYAAPMPAAELERYLRERAGLSA